MSNADRCVCCGEIIPEGTMACPNCLVVSKKETKLKPCPCIKCFFTYFGRFSICFPSGLCSDKYEWLLRKKGGKEE